MKKITLLFIFLLSLNFLGLAQLTDKEITFQKTVITGKVKQYQPDRNQQEIRVYLYRPEENRAEVHRADVAPDGSFKISFDLAFFQEVYIDYYTSLGVLLNPGDNIQINIKGYNRKKKFLEVTFSGDNKQINKEWDDFRRNYFKVAISSIFDAQKEMDFEAYAKFRRNYKEREDKSIVKFAKKIKPDKQLINWLENNSKWNYLGDIVRYPMAHAYYNKMKQVDVDLPDTYEKFLLNLPNIEWPDLSNAANINTFSFAYSSNTSAAAGAAVARVDESLKEEEWHKLYGAGLENAKLPKTGLLFQMMISQRALTFIKIGEIDTYKAYYEPLVNKYVKQQFLLTKIEKILEEKLYYINNPSAASEAILKNLDKINTGSPFNQILEEHKGKVVYLDFWGTWCSPCIAEFPNSKKLHEELNEKEVVFAYACIDSKEKVWKAGLTEYELKGSHYFFNKKESDEIRKALEINGIPFYLIIDKEGNIIDKGSHIRPSNKKTQEKLNLLLK